MLPAGLRVVSVTRARRIVVVSASENNRANVPKGKQYQNKSRRRGRPAWMRSPYDSPLRDGNRDRLIGLLTERAAKTLMVYLMETNANVYSWLVNFYKENPIPRNGNWDEVSGEAFLRKLLSMSIEEAKYNTGRDSLFDNVRSCGVDPRSIAQRIMDIRTQLSEEFIQELQAIAEENSQLLRETLQTSLLTSTVDETDTPDAAASSSSKGQAPTATSGSSTVPAQAKDAASPPKAKDAAGRGKPKAPAPVPKRPPTTWTRQVHTTDSSSSGAGKEDGSNPSSDAADAADKAAAVAALNAALKASPSLPADAASGHPELQTPAAAQDGAAVAGAGAGTAAGLSSDGDGGKIAMEDVIAQLKRSLDADVAVLTGWDVAAAGAAAGDSSSSLANLAETATGNAASEETAADVAAPEVEAAAAAAPVADAPAADALDVPEQDAAAAVDPAAAASATAAASDASSTPLPGALPKGWGPRLGVGFSQLPVRNNIVRLGDLGSKAGSVSSSVDGAAATAAEPNSA